MELPPFWPQFTDRVVIRRDSQRNHQKESRHANDHIGTLYNVGPNLRGNLQIEEKPNRQVQRDIEKAQPPGGTCAGSHQETGAVA